MNDMDSQVPPYFDPHILQALVAQPGISFADLATHLDWHPNMLKRVLDDLTGAGIVTCREYPERYPIVHAIPHEDTTTYELDLEGVLFMLDTLWPRRPTDYDTFTSCPTC